MTFFDRIDPECRVALEAVAHLMPADWSLEPAARRQAGEALLAAMTADQPPIETVRWQDRSIPGLPGEPDIAVRIYHPLGASGPYPGLLFIHGGGMWGGSIAHEHVQAASLCSEQGAVVVSVAYRLAPEHPHPAPVHDCYAACCWMADNASALQVDLTRLAVVGGSAGGGLALGLALMARDQGGPRLCSVMALYPMIDDRSETPSAHEFTDLGIVWDRTRNIEGWSWYLSGQPADAYAAPARAERLAGLPPIFIDVGELDLFRDEDIRFAQRLMQAGVPTELHVYPGAFHASEFLAPAADLSRRILRTRSDALRRALHPSGAATPSAESTGRQLQPDVS
ncbi:alpha/beta hydrolase (plasmid) [Deinococcus sp. KNUC1210]|uniref:alpha/beta hydrolase n=1 Tax=Deinococcus sp. KNUC1210 TaxID=2917691 RepID=UPI001EF074E8|nr:alpha/beta hydrolase [Deinococcus sp. KNUC1210]ULH17050.1 alpha/beta hydrolase [Deinococcus sp. KNUC1210]